jgi:hydrogenase maturation factor
MSSCESEEVCVTCSDQATPAEVLRLEGDGMALVRMGETTELISVALVDVEVGATVMVHAGEAIGVLSGGDNG